MNYVFAIWGACLALGCTAATFGYAGVTDADADTAFQQAVEKYQAERQPVLPMVIEPEDDGLPKVDVQVWTKEDPSITPDRSHPHYTAGMINAETHLSDVEIQVDMEDITLKDALGKVVNKVGSVTGPWELKWRVDPENRYVMDERVNLIAESSFGEFVTYLVDRVKNMTGVKLFITVFEGSRIIIVSDTYY